MQDDKTVMVHWVGKRDKYGTLWPHDGPHSNEQSAKKSAEQLRAINKKDRFELMTTQYKRQWDKDGCAHCGGKHHPYDGCY